MLLKRTAKSALLAEFGEHVLLRLGGPSSTLLSPGPRGPCIDPQPRNPQVTRLPLLFALQDAAPSVVPADTAWMLVSTALVLLMTPALAFFYGGLVRSKNSLNTMMMSFAALGAVGIVWALIAYSLAFAEGNAWIGGTTNALLAGVGTEAKGTIPHVLFMAYQGTFAIITAALISGAIVERMRFGPYLVFIALWTLLVYAPVAHWVWGGGWLMSRGVLDFAGGTVVHINAGVSALVAALVLGVRKDYGRQAILPHNVPFVLLGAGLLWFGWFGFNGGSALAANELAGAGLHQHVPGPHGDAGRVGAARLLPHRARHGRRRCDGHRDRPGGDHAGRRVHQPDERTAARRPGRVPELLHDRRPLAHPAGRFAGCVRRSRHRRHHRRPAHRRLRVEGVEPGRGNDGLLAGNAASSAPRRSASSARSCTRRSPPS